MRPGEVVAGKFVVEQVLGRGGMGEVVVARHSLLGERVAIKTLLSHSDPESVQRFLNEARASLRIRSEHVVRVSDVDLLADGRPYMVMELLEGRDLETRLQDEGSLPLGEAVDLVLQACEGVAEAHSIGIVHRDLKPANMFLTRRNDGTARLVLLDFGISKFVDPQAPAHGMTSATGLMGSPSYMSPEQFQNPRDVDPRTDVWALGVVLFRCLTGRLPFLAESVPALVVKVLHEPPASLRALRPDLPPLLDGIVRQCLQRAREQRFPGVAALAQALAPFASREGARSVDRLRALAPGSSPPPIVAAAASSMGETRASPALPVGPAGAMPATREVLAVPAPAGVSQQGSTFDATATPTAAPPLPTAAPPAKRPLALVVGATTAGAAALALVLVFAVGGSTPSTPTRKPGKSTLVTEPDEPKQKPKASAEPEPTTTAPPPSVASVSSPAVATPKPKPAAAPSLAPGPTASPSGIPTAVPTPAPTPSINDNI